MVIILSYAKSYLFRYLFIETLLLPAIRPSPLDVVYTSDYEVYWCINPSIARFLIRIQTSLHNVLAPGAFPEGD